MNIDLFGNIIGYIGMITCVVAFFMVQKEKPNMILYNISNLFASSCLLISLLIHMNIASFSLEIFWIIGSMYGLIMAIKRKNKNIKK